MKVVRYSHGDTTSYGELRGDIVIPLTGEMHDLRPVAEAGVLPVSQVRLLAPAQPSKIIAIGPGYRVYLQGGPLPHRPYYWLKGPNTVQDPEGNIVLPPGLTVNHEAEIAIVISRRASMVSPEEALDYVLGYTCCIDVTAGDMADRGTYMQTQLFVDGKIFDTFAPLGPHIETELDTADLRIRCHVNGELRHDHSTSDKIWEYDTLVSMISHIVTLEPGDVITTGSVPGVAPMQAGDTIELEVEGIGVLRNYAVAG